MMAANRKSHSCPVRPRCGVCGEDSLLLKVSLCIGFRRKPDPCGIRQSLRGDADGVS